LLHGICSHSLEYKIVLAFSARHNELFMFVAALTVELEAQVHVGAARTGSSSGDVLSKDPTNGEDAQRSAEVDQLLRNEFSSTRAALSPEAR
jgi:hypothetical protein